MSRSLLLALTCKMLSTTPHLATLSMKGCGSSHLDPKLLALRVKFSLVCIIQESEHGGLITQMDALSRNCGHHTNTSVQ